MLNSQAANSANATSLLMPGAKADTAAATSAWTAVTAKSGYVVIIQHVGTITAGSLAGKIQSADDGSGTNAADVTGATFTSVTTSNDAPNIQRLVLPATVGPYIAYVGTVTTGPLDMSVTMLTSPQSV